MSTTSPPPRRPFSRALALAIAALFLSVGFGGWLLGTLSPTTGYPSNTSAEAGFARDMQTHHQQAVELSMIIRDNSSNEAVRTFAYDIALTQQQQTGQMFAWLNLWGLPQTSSQPEMAWMSTRTLDGADPHAGHGTQPEQAHTRASMGMATTADIAKLTVSSGTAADKLYLTLMIAHHRGGVAMAQALLPRSTDPLVTGFAHKVITSQESEITALTNLLESLR